jgi:1-phosphatidylinositol phosphodiesterase
MASILANDETNPYNMQYGVSPGVLGPDRQGQARRDTNCLHRISDAALHTDLENLRSVLQSRYLRESALRAKNNGSPIGDRPLIPSGGVIHFNLSSPGSRFRSILRQTLRTRTYAEFNSNCPFTMVAEHLTIRNNTSTPIALKRIERFQAPEKDGFAAFSTMARNFTQVLTNQTRNDEVSSIEQDSRPFEEKDVDIHVEPFATKKTELRSFIHSDKERMRLIFEAEGQRYQIQVPVPTAESAGMKALSENPKHRFTGVFVTPESFLAIFSSANLNAWMRELRDDTLVSALSIPGTHNSPTCHIAPPSVRCQAVSPKEQLENGVRFFDIRVQPQYPEDAARDELVLVHSAFPISLTGNKYFRDLMREVDEFLDRNPSETLIVSVKREGTGNATDEQLSRILHDHYAKAGSRWWVRPKIPTLGEARGKVILMRRFNLQEKLKGEHGGNGWGIDAAAWADNTPNAKCPSGQLCIQDFYEVMETMNIEKKIKFVSEQIDRASCCRYPFGVQPDMHATKAFPFYVNFLSASNFWKTDTWPEKVAAKVNPAIVDYICRRGKDHDADCSTGILVTDWVGLHGDWDLVRCIVGMNAKLRLRQE